MLQRRVLRRLRARWVRKARQTLLVKYIKLATIIVAAIIATIHMF